MSERVDKLAGRGIIAFEVDGVLGRLTKRQSIDVDLSAELGRFVQAGAAIGAAVKRRMRDRGVHADGSRWSPSGSSPLRISVRYASLAGVSASPGRMLVRSGAGARATWHQRTSVGLRSLAALYAASRSAGAYDVTGGMWRGLVARPWGKLGVRLAFDGTSQGRGEWVRVGETLRGEPVWELRKKSERNWKKAGAVLLSARQNPIEVSVSELQGVASAVASTAAIAVVRRAGRVAALSIRYDGDEELARQVASVLARA